MRIRFWNRRDPSQLTLQEHLNLQLLNQKTTLLEIRNLAAAVADLENRLSTGDRLQLAWDLKTAIRALQWHQPQCSRAPVSREEHSDALGRLERARSQLEQVIKNLN